MAQQTQALAKITDTQRALDEAQIDPRLLMAAKAIQLMGGTNKDGTPKVSADMALAAAMYQAGTGQLLGRDFYVNDKVGRMEGYRGVARDAVDRGVGEMQIKYRPITANEADENEVQAGDTAVACEVYQLRAWRLAQRIGQPYEPVVGIGIIRKAEKFTTKEWDDSSRRYVQLPESRWRPINLEGGMTWRKKAQNRAYKEALRHTPGMSTADEVLEEAALAGVPMPPDTARLDLGQALEWVRLNQPEDRGPEWPENEEATEAEFTPQPQPQPALQPQPTNGDKPAAWDEARKAKAIGWAMQNYPGTFKAGQHARNALEKFLTEHPDASSEMWMAEVVRRFKEAQQAAQDGLGVEDEQPLFQ